MANLAFGIMYILPQFKNPHYKCKKTQRKNKQQYTQRQHKANLSVYIMPQWPISIIIPFLKERLRHGKRTEPIPANCPLTSERVSFVCTCTYTTALNRKTRHQMHTACPDLHVLVTCTYQIQ